MLKVNKNAERFIEVVVHALAWTYLLLTPLLFRSSEEVINWRRVGIGSIIPAMHCLTFYVNYFVLIPRFVMKRKGMKWFFLINLALFVCYQFGAEMQCLWMRPERWGEMPPPHPMPPKYTFIIRGAITFFFTIALSVALKLSMQWRASEQARAEAELGRSQAELSNLKSQINPHFLLNTLNNIYALIAFDPDRAQKAVAELGRLLRYMLQENHTERVDLNKEADFLTAYIALMKLRLPAGTDVTADFDFPREARLQVAPLVFVSLVENAFKHGVSAMAPSFIHISLKADAERLTFTCTNSNFPKDKTDKAPGGIGLQQVAARLQAAYPGRFAWSYGVRKEGRIYVSTIDLYNITEAFEAGHKPIKMP